MRLFLVAILALIPVAHVATQTSDKNSRTVAQRKIDSQLLQEIERRATSTRGGGERPQTRIKIDDKDRVLVDVRVDVTPAMRKTVTDLEATIVSESVEYRSIVAWIPLLKLETLAENEAVYAIVPAAEPATNR